MAFLFRTRGKTPNEIVRACLEELQQLDKKKDAKAKEKNIEEITKHIQSMKFILVGDGENAPAPDQIAQLANEICHQDLLPLLIQYLGDLDFESRKDTVLIFSTILRRQIGSRFPTVEYLASKRPEVMNMLMKGYESQPIMLSCGQMLRDSIQFSDLSQILLDSPFFFKFFEYVEMSVFAGASDAFATFKLLLTQHKTIAAAFLEKKYTEFFKQYAELLSSSNYVTKRQSVKLLGEILLDRAYFSIMTRFISDEANLKIIMILLRDKFSTIQIEAFHVFKVFVANPRKPPEIVHILQRNRDRLIAFLQALQGGKGEDESFNEEKQVLIREISALPRLA
eukprot:TRINITY_DN9047_c0_g1_i1.p1 TRINITY_DN9047_c0_g1~~TRINITY_DN9047_c0_g1_i1.p1  ORF type:complete len:338 (-),score=89.74 TRINITY_DN9047_c0_g1_i1:512-1525(-)